jgi:hypothetical protein
MVIQGLLIITWVLSRSIEIINGYTVGDIKFFCFDYADDTEPNYTVTNSFLSQNLAVLLIMEALQSIII